MVINFNKYFESLPVFCLAMHPFGDGKSDDVSCKNNKVLKPRL